MPSSRSRLPWGLRRRAPRASCGNRPAGHRRSERKCGKNVQNVSNIYKNVEMLKKSLMTPHF
jgi:hypothetical protein